MEDCDWQLDNIIMMFIAWSSGQKQNKHIYATQVLQGTLNYYVNI